MPPTPRVPVLKVVVVAFVVVDCVAVNFWRVVDELAWSCWKEETRVVEVAVIASTAGVVVTPKELVLLQ